MKRSCITKVNWNIPKNYCKPKETKFNKKKIY